MYIDSVNKSGTNVILGGFTNTLVCSTAYDTTNKVVTIPNGYTTDDTYMTIRVLFVNGYYGTSSLSAMKLVLQHEDGTYFDESSTSTAYDIKSYQDGSLATLPVHNVASSSYKVIDPNICLEMYYDGTQFVVVGNPLVLSSSTYQIYANGYVEGGHIGDVVATSLSWTTSTTTTGSRYSTPPYGWLECRGQSLSRTIYSKLFNYFNTHTIYDADTSSVKTLLNVYGYASSTTFYLPDYRESALVGASASNYSTTYKNSRDTIDTHDIYTVGQFKDDQVQNITGDVGLLSTSGANYASGAFFQNTHSETYNSQGNEGQKGLVKFDASRVARTGAPDVTRGKRKGVQYLIKVL